MSHEIARVNIPHKFHSNYLVYMKYDSMSHVHPSVAVVTNGVNSNVGWELSFPVSFAYTPATLPSKQTAQAAAEHKQEVKSLNLNL